MGRKRRASKFAKCIGREMKGRKFPSKGAARSAFRAAVRKCK